MHLVFFPPRFASSFTKSKSVQWLFGQDGWQVVSDLFKDRNQLGTSFRMVVLHHVVSDGAEAELAEAVRVLARDGVLILLGLNRMGWRYRTQERIRHLPGIAPLRVKSCLEAMGMTMQGFAGAGLAGMKRPAWMHSGLSSLGAPVAVSTPAFPEVQLTGVVDVIEPQLDPATRTVGIVALVENPDEVLRPGMSATIAVVLLQHAINLFNDAADWRLGADVEAPGPGLQKPVDERLADPFGQCRVTLRFSRPAEDPRETLGQLRRLKEVGRGREGDGLGVEALVVADAAIDDVAVGMFLVQIDPAARHLVLLGDDAPIAVVLVELRHQQRVGEAPADGAGVLGIARRRDPDERGGESSFQRRRLCHNRQNNTNWCVCHSGTGMTFDTPYALCGGAVHFSFAWE